MTLHAFCSGDLHDVDTGNLLRLLLFAPLIEEWIVRAGLHEWLMRSRGDEGNHGWLGGAANIVLAAAFFSVLHARAGTLAAGQVFVPGLAMGALYQRYRDWRLCALLHALFNGMALGACAVIF